MKLESGRVEVLNLATDFPDRWQAFLNRPSDGMVFSVDRARLPGASDRKVTGMYLHHEQVDDRSRQAVTSTAPSSSPGAFKAGISLPLVNQGQDPTHTRRGRWPSPAAQPSPAPGTAAPSRWS